MLLADARLPVAGHTQSAGLEPALRASLRATSRPPRPGHLGLARRVCRVRRTLAQL